MALSFSLPLCRPLCLSVALSATPSLSLLSLLAQTIWSRPRALGDGSSAAHPPLFGGVQVLVAAMSAYQGMTGKSPA